MFRSLARSWKLVQQSWSVLMKDKALLLFPLLSGVVVLLVLASIAIPSLLLGVFTSMKFGFPVFVPIFGFYFLSTMVVIFFNSAMTCSTVFIFVLRCKGVEFVANTTSVPSRFCLLKPNVRKKRP